jgi:hypothetical protein
MNRDQRLSTADLARAAHPDEQRPRTDASEMRGEAREQIKASENAAVAERPVNAPPLRTPGPRQAHQDGAAPLFPEKDADDFRQRWTGVQTGFVDEPRRAVEQADALVADVMSRLADSFAAERGSLEKQWDRGDNVTTEDLRIALQRYRSFFDRLLSA